jgi:virulence-associated protein VagC
MEEFILNVNTLPEPLHRQIRSKRVKVHEADGVFTLTPLTDKGEYTSRLFGMFSDGKLSSESFMTQKQAEKELEQ